MYQIFKFAIRDNLPQNYASQSLHDFLSQNALVSV